MNDDKDLGCFVHNYPAMLTQGESNDNQKFECREIFTFNVKILYKTF